MTEPQKMADGEALTLRLRWRETWPDRSADYVAEAAGYTGTIGRISVYDAGPQQGMWFWAMNAHAPEISRNVGELHGVEKSPRAAARMVEDAWFAAALGSSLDHPAPTLNAHARAKGTLQSFLSYRYSSESSRRTFA